MPYCGSPRFLHSSRISSIDSAEISSCASGFGVSTTETVPLVSNAKGKVEGFIPAVKLVRGAYLEKENLRAQTLGYQTPMQANKGATDQDFNLALRFCLDHIDIIALCAGTHNEESCYLLTHLMKEKGIANDHPYIAFAQLYGMSDHISYNLGSEGYRVAKYLPYGPVKSVLPYLFRRAEENTSIKGQTGRELELIRKELKRRSGKV